MLVDSTIKKQDKKTTLTKSKEVYLSGPLKAIKFHRDQKDDLYK